MKISGKYFCKQPQRSAAAADVETRKRKSQKCIGSAEEAKTARSRMGKRRRNGYYNNNKHNDTLEAQTREREVVVRGKRRGRELKKVSSKGIVRSEVR